MIWRARAYHFIVDWCGAPGGIYLQEGQVLLTRGTSCPRLFLGDAMNFQTAAAFASLVNKRSSSSADKKDRSMQRIFGVTCCFFLNKNFQQQARDPTVCFRACTAAAPEGCVWGRSHMKWISAHAQRSGIGVEASGSVCVFNSYTMAAAATFITQHFWCSAFQTNWRETRNYTHVDFDRSGLLPYRNSKTMLFQLGR